MKASIFPVNSLHHPDREPPFFPMGVVEARDRTSALFGFDRTPFLGYRPAGEIALTAQQFGQEDDITVLTLTFDPCHQVWSSAVTAE